MKKSTKKIIAREFLFLLSSIVLFFIVILIWNSLNNSSNKEVETISTEIENIKRIIPSNEIVLAESFRIELDTIVLRMTNAMESEKSIQSVVDLYKEMYGIPEYAFNSKIENIILEKKQEGDTDKELKKIIENYKKEFDLKRTDQGKNYEQLTKLKKELKNIKSSFFQNSIESAYIINLIAIILSILFGLRYIYYGTKWSVKQLKE
jgi:hypothetical protein